MQFIRNMLSDLQKCARIVRITRKLWKYGSKFVRTVIVVVLVSVLSALLCFVGFEISNMLSARSRNLLRLQQTTLSSSGAKRSDLNKSDIKKELSNSKNKRSKAEYSKKRTASNRLWKSPTGGAYPNISGIKAENIKVNVNLKKQRVYIIAEGKTVYSMIMSSGVNDSTPHGDYHINMRGKHFFNENEGIGADYWVGFIGAQYLFHSVPTSYNFGDYIPSEGRKLGSPASHGCVRLSVPDAKWFYDHIPDGAKVHIG